MRTASFFLAGVLTLGTAHAQLAKPTGLEIAVETLAGNNRCLGVCRTEVLGQERFWVTAGSLVVGNPHVMFELDRQGNLLATYNQPTSHLGTVPTQWGIRDMAFDGQYMYGGGDNQSTLPNPNMVYAFDPVGRTYVAASHITLVAPPIPIVRALAYNQITQRFYTSNFGGAAYEFDRTGVFVQTIPVSGAGSMYGASHDLGGNLYWQLGQAGGHLTTIQTVITGFDLTNQVALGNTNKTYGDISHNSSGAPNIGGLAGGIDTYYINGKLHAIYLTQAAPDSIIELYLDLNSGTTCSAGGGGPAYHVLNSAPPWSGNLSLTMDVTNAPGFAGGISLLFLSLPGAPVPLPPPFAAGCNLLIGFAPFLFMGNTVVGPTGTGTYPLPLPAGIPMNTVLTFQSIILDAIFSRGATSQATAFATK